MPSVDPRVIIPVVESLAGSMLRWLHASESAQKSVSGALAHASEQVDQALGRVQARAADAEAAGREAQAFTKSVAGAHVDAEYVASRTDTVASEAARIHGLAAAAEQKWQALLVTAQQQLSVFQMEAAHWQAMVDVAWLEVGRARVALAAAQAEAGSVHSNDPDIRSQQQAAAQARIAAAQAAVDAAESRWRIALARLTEAQAKVAAAEQECQRCAASVETARNAMAQASTAVASATTARERAESAVRHAARARSEADIAVRAGAEARQAATDMADRAREARNVADQAGHLVVGAERTGREANERARSAHSAMTRAAADLREYDRDTLGL